MPRIKDPKKQKQFDEMNELRRNFRLLNPDQIERYVRGETLYKILGKKYKHGMK